MCHGDGGVGFQCYLPLIGVLVFGQFALLLLVLLGVLQVFWVLVLVVLGRLKFLGVVVPFVLIVGYCLFLVEPLVGLFEERDMVVQCLHVERGVDVEVAVVCDGVAE